MALVKVKPDIARPPRAGQGGQRPTCTRASRTAPLVEPQKRGAAATTSAASPCATRAAATSSTIASSTSAATRTASPAKVERLEYDPNRSAHIALLLYADGERRYIIAPKGVAVGTQLMSGSEAPIKAGNALPLAQHPGRHRRCIASR